MAYIGSNRGYVEGGGPLANLSEWDQLFQSGQLSQIPGSSLRDLGNNTGYLYNIGQDRIPLSVDELSSLGYFSPDYANWASQTFGPDKLQEMAGQASLGSSLGQNLTADQIKQAGFDVDPTTGQIFKASDKYITNAQFIPDLQKWNQEAQGSGLDKFMEMAIPAAMAGIGFFGGPLTSLGDISNLASLSESGGMIGSGVSSFGGGAISGLSGIDTPPTGAMSSTAQAQNPLYNQFVENGLITNPAAELTSSLPFSTTAELASVPWGASPGLYESMTSGASWTQKLGEALKNPKVADAASSLLGSAFSSPLNQGGGMGGFGGSGDFGGFGGGGGFQAQTISGGTPQKLDIPQFTKWDQKLGVNYDPNQDMIDLLLRGGGNAY